MQEEGKVDLDPIAASRSRRDCRHFPMPPETALCVVTQGKQVPRHDQVVGVSSGLLWCEQSLSGCDAVGSRLGFDGSLSFFP